MPNYDDDEVRNLLGMIDDLISQPVMDGIRIVINSIGIQPPTPQLLSAVSMSTAINTILTFKAIDDDSNVKEAAIILRDLAYKLIDKYTVEYPSTGSSTDKDDIRRN
jgi:hypothetical protein